MTGIRGKIAPWSAAAYLYSAVPTMLNGRERQIRGKRIKAHQSAGARGIAFTLIAIFPLLQLPPGWLPC